MLRAGLLESDGPALNQGRKTQNYRFLCWRELAVIPIYEPLGFSWLRPRAWLTFCFPHLQLRTLGTCREVKEVFFLGGFKDFGMPSPQVKGYWLEHLESIWAILIICAAGRLRLQSRGERQKTQSFTTSPSAENESRRCTCTILLETAGSLSLRKTDAGIQPRALWNKKRHVGGWRAP